MGLLVIVLVLTYLAPRLAGIDRVVTVDEPLWLGRSANFYQAMRSANFENTNQFAHPGVMTMWAGAIAYAVAFPGYAGLYDRQIQNWSRIDQVLRELGRDPLELMIAGRIVKLLMQTVFLTIGFWLACPVFDTLLTVVATLLITSDPFLIAHDRLLHVDSMFAVTAFVSLLALIRALSAPRLAPFLAISGAFAAFAWLTRAPGVVLVSIVGLVFLGQAWQRWRRGGPLARSLKSAIRPLAIWTGAAAVTTVLAWPALWVAPVATAKSVLDWSLNATAEGHDRAIFFYGDIMFGDPGMQFYPLTLLWRLTPFSLAGLAILLVALAVHARTIVPRHLWLPIAILGGYALLYMVGMSFGAKKFDRYLLPVYPALDMLAAVGLVGAARFIAHQRAHIATLLGRVALAGAIAGQLVIALLAAPYYLPYFNPLMGGTTAAEDALLLGWGEGMDQVAAFILAQPDGENAVIDVPHIRRVVAYFLPESATVNEQAFPVNMRGVIDWANTDYATIYVSQRQRDMEPEFNAYLSAHEPVHTVSLNGVAFAHTYDLDVIPPPAWLVNSHDCSFAFADAVQLVAFHRTPAAGASSTLTLFFTSLPAATERYEVRIDLVTKGVSVKGTTRTAPLLPAATTGMLSRVDYPLTIPPDHTLGDYFLIVTVVDPATKQPIPATQVTTGHTSQQALMPRCR